jgi:hypothetical protein
MSDGHFGWKFAITFRGPLGGDRLPPLADAVCLSCLLMSELMPLDRLAAWTATHAQEHGPDDCTLF